MSRLAKRPTDDLISKESRVPIQAQSELSRRARIRQGGQLIPFFALSIFVLLGMMAIVIDVSWYWSNTLKVQRAADAAALAGAVWLPGNVPVAYSTARQEATKNGYTTGSGITVTPIQNSLTSGGTNPNELDVTVTAPVNTFFMRVFGFTSITATRASKAEYIQPVPMGSPLNYYGVYQNCKVSGSSIACSPIPDASNPVNTLASQGFFGAIEGQGSNRATGDAYATGFNADPSANSQYDPKGYDYIVNVEAGGSTVYIYDPTFCATTSGPGGGHLGAGDHWLSTTNHNTAVPVSTYYQLIDTHGTQFTTSDDTVFATSGNLFKNEFQVDKSAAYCDRLPGPRRRQQFQRRHGAEPERRWQCGQLRGRSDRQPGRGRLLAQQVVPARLERPGWRLSAQRDDDGSGEFDPEPEPGLREHVVLRSRRWRQRERRNAHDHRSGAHGLVCEYRIRIADLLPRPDRRSNRRRQDDGHRLV